MLCYGNVSRPHLSTKGSELSNNLPCYRRQYHRQHLDQQQRERLEAHYARYEETQTVEVVLELVRDQRRRALQLLDDLLERIEADLIVVGSKGMSGAGRFLLGSVPDRVSHHASCTVLIVRTA